MKNLVIYGCGSVGRMIEQIVFDINQVASTWNVLGFIDDDQNKIGSQVADLPVLGDLSAIPIDSDTFIAIGFSSPRQKKTAVEYIKSVGSFNLATLIHPRAWISRSVHIGEGAIIYPGVHIDVDVNIGCAVVLNKVCTVGHDTNIGDYSTAAPGVNLGGNCQFDTGVEFGINSATIQGIEIGAWSVIGGAAMVTKPIPPNSVAVGVPAKVIKQQIPN